MFELCFLGTAAAVPSAERGLPAVVVSRGPSRFLVDCGEGTQRQMMRARLGFLFEEEPRRPLLRDRLEMLGVPEGPQREALARGRPVVVADGHQITPEMVQGPASAGAKLAVVGDTEEVASLIEPVRGADAL